MKKFIVAFAAVALIAGVALVGLGNGRAKTAPKSGILSVSDIEADPSSYKGTITVTGVVAMIKGDSRLFAMVDTNEAKHCKSTGCAQFYLPAKYEGALPGEWDEVNVTGSLVRDGRLVFKAERVEVLRHLSFGGQ